MFRDAYMWPFEQLLFQVHFHEAAALRINLNERFVYQAAKNGNERKTNEVDKACKRLEAGSGS